MSWKKKYDKCTMDNEGDLIIFGDHYNLKGSRSIIIDENYDDPLNWCNPKYLYVKFGFVNFEGEVTNGFLEFDKYKKGRIKATKLMLS